MQPLPLEGDLLPRVVQALTQSPLFATLAPDVLAQVAGRGALWTAEAGDVLMTQAEESTSFYVVLAGEIAVLVAPAGGGDAVEITRLRPPDSLGEMGLLLGQPRSATAIAQGRALLLQFESAAFQIMYERLPGFGLAMSRALAARLASSARQFPMPVVDDSAGFDADLLPLLPREFIERHRVLPVRDDHGVLVLGCVDDASARAIGAVRELLPGMEIRPQRISAALFERALSSAASLPGWTQPAAASSSSSSAAPRSSPRLDALLRRLVAEGGSDLHISGSQRPRWRVDGEMLELSDVGVLSERDVYDLLEPVLDDRARKAFDDDNDVDFAYAIAGLARFRVNMFRDKGGVGAVLRVIPAKILSFEQLNLPPVCQKLCEHPKGLVLVTGPTGSGKSTTLAAMIDWINKNRRAHIITLEDPIEFVHESRGCMINQREVGAHTRSFQRALKAALREDPDIVLVGEMRDLETVSLALETANTGHLVFGTLHTATAISTMDRIIDLFPPDQQTQVRAVLADTLKGVVAQTLCKRIGGGRIAALETLVVNYAISNLIREGKTHQIASSMSTSKALGNTMLNDALAQLVLDNKVDFADAYARAVDKADLARRCNKQPPTEASAR